MVDDALLCRRVEAAPSGASTRHMTADGSGGKRQGLAMAEGHDSASQRDCASSGAARTPVTGHAPRHGSSAHPATLPGL